MEFYCPVCQVVVAAEPETQVTTKLGQTVFKAHCPTCSQDMAGYQQPLEPIATQPSQN